MSTCESNFLEKLTSRVILTPDECVELAEWVKTLQGRLHDAEEQAKYNGDAARSVAERLGDAEKRWADLRVDNERLAAIVFQQGCRLHTIAQLGAGRIKPACIGGSCETLTTIIEIARAVETHHDRKGLVDLGWFGPEPDGAGGAERRGEPADWEPCNVLGCISVKGHATPHVNKDYQPINNCSVPGCTLILGHTTPCRDRDYLIIPVEKLNP